MTSIILLLSFILLLLIRLALRKKWKALIWTMVSLILLTIVGWFLFQKSISAFGPTCEENRKWQIEEYIIMEEKCIGIAGPPYYPLSLYRDQKEIAYGIIKDDSSCVIQFIPEPGDTLTFDLCNGELN